MQDKSKPFLTLIGAGMEEQQFTYLELLARSLAWTAVYRDHGLGAGSYLVVILPHSLDLYAAYTGALMGGMIPAMFSFPSPKYSMEEYVKTFGTLLANAGPNLVVMYPQLKQVILTHLPGELRSVPICDSSRVDPSRASAEASAIADPDPEHTAFLQYSSGTTGLRKGVAISHRALIRQVRDYSRAIELGSDETIVSWLPLYHDMGLICGYFLPLLMRVPIVAMSAFDWVRNPAMLMNAITKHRATRCWLPNFAYSFMAQGIGDRDLEGIDVSSLRGVVNCSEPVLAESHRRFLSRFASCGFRAESLGASYAMAENTFAVTSGGMGRPLQYEYIDSEIFIRESRAVPVMPIHPKARLMVSSGTALPDTRIVIRSETGQVLPERHIGRIVISGPTLFAEYYRNPEATSKSRSGDAFQTGDLGYLSEGHLFVIGRADDVIIIAGKNIYPQDIEQLLHDIPGVIPGRCVAFGIADAEKGTNQLIILAESNATDSGEQAAIRGEIFRRVASQTETAPDEIHIVEHQWLLKTSSGKIARKANREKFLVWQESRRDTSSIPAEVGIDETSTENGSESSEPARVYRCVRTILSKKKRATDWLHEDQPLITSGLIDSLTLVSLVLELEKEFGVTIPPSRLDLVHFETIKNIRAMLKGLGNPQDNQDMPDHGTAMTEREKKCWQFLHLGRKIDTLILGSSKAQGFDPRLAESAGYQTYNFWVNSGRAEDWYCIVRFVMEHNKTPLRNIIVCMDIEAFSNAVEIDRRLLHTTYLSRYLEEPDRAAIPQLDMESFSGNTADKERFQSVLLQYKLGQTSQNLRHVKIDPNYGHSVDAAVPADRGALVITDPLGSAPEYSLRMKGFTGLHRARLHYFVRLLELCRTNAIRISCCLAPLHTKLHRFLEGHTTYGQRLDDLRRFLGAVRYEGFRFLDTPTVGSFGGFEDDFSDGAHIGAANSDILLRHLLGISLNRPLDRRIEWIEQGSIGSPESIRQ